jgi:hypothetical protein
LSPGHVGHEHQAQVVARITPLIPVVILAISFYRVVSCQPLQRDAARYTVLLLL